MLNEKVFEKGIGKLVTEYSDRGFTMSKEKAAQWYDFLKNKKDDDFEYAINEILETNKFPPLMADVIEKIYERPKQYIDARDYDVNGGVT